MLLGVWRGWEGIPVAHTTGAVEEATAATDAVSRVDDVDVDVVDVTGADDDDVVVVVRDDASDDTDAVS